ncbi:hypothetical protein MPTK1_2g09580 [Marchantia polymorpha subsp. ruderalis]|uniref:Uncharacterized protein n=1 Tax=Marchantia polymorpha TaxID=3197 RepID=A0A2R6W484_MARPO|nr:hypothetical protein MARPO_0158s0029 [Marchantia polymorpha]BBN01698.1 hypothetical protein Mp_2g09580 [Marchantia polymorpha subsp. ruderalis]|eukprot:PTQ28651.1 hypothetical protein MARPO_0158s0029 [Marchantia polymorpha]
MATPRRHLSFRDRLRNVLFYRATNEAVKSWDSFESKLFPFGWQRSVKTLDHFKRVYWLPETNLQLVLPGEFKELTSIHMLEICVSSHTAFEVREVLERPF